MAERATADMAMSGPSSPHQLDHHHHHHHHSHSELDYSHLSPCSREGDCSGCTFGPDGQLLIGGLSIDGSGPGESGWASPPGSDFASRRTGNTADRVSLRKLALLPRSTKARAAKEQDFVPCSPRDGPSTFGSGAVTQSSSSQSADEKENASAERSAKVSGWHNTAGGSTAENAKPAKVQTVNLADIVEGRTCRPIALVDLRTYLAARREIEEDQQQQNTPSLPMSPTLSNALTGDGIVEVAPTATLDSKSGGFSLDGGPLHVTLPSLTATQAAGNLDATSFVVAFDRYTRAYRNLPETEQRRSPRPFDVAERIGGFDATSTAVLSQAGIEPPSQPLRDNFNRLVTTYIGDFKAPLLAKSLSSASSTDTPNSERNSIGGVRSKVVQLATPIQSKVSSAPPKMRRLDWMVDLGLLSEQAISQALFEAELTTHPEVLLPLVNAVSTYLDAHVLPSFMATASQNLSRGTARGRMAMGCAATVLALLFSVLLIVNPSPLTSTRIPRWYRVLTFPLWAMGIGYFIASFTRVCVWLSLRGNREKSQEEEWQGTSPRGSLEWAQQQQRRGSAASAGMSAGAPAAEPSDPLDDEGNLSEVDQSNWLVAPEIRRFLPFLPQSIGKSSGGDAVVMEQRQQSQQSQAISRPSTVLQRERATTSARVLTPVSEGTGPILGSEGSGRANGVSMERSASARPLAEPLRGPSGAMGLSAAAASDAPMLRSKSISVLPGVELGVRTIAAPALNSESSLGGSTVSPSLQMPRSPSNSGQAFGLGSMGRRGSGSRPMSFVTVEEGRAFQKRGTPMEPSMSSSKHRFWDSLQQWTGFAVGTEKVRDKRVRQMHQWEAFKALLLDSVISVIVVIVIVAIP